MATMATITAATANTMPNEAGGDRAGTRPGTRLAGLLAAGAGALLLLGAVPRLAAAVVSLPARPVLWDLREGMRVPPDRLADAETRLARGAALADSGTVQADRGYLLLNKALALPPGDAGPVLLRQAAAATEAGLALSPVQPAAWARLAWLRSRMGDPAGAERALRLSFLSGPVVPAMTVSRIQFGLDLRPHLGAETQQLLDRQLRLAWVLVPDSMVAMADRADVGPAVRAALAGLAPAEIDAYTARWGRRPPTLPAP